MFYASSLVNFDILKDFICFKTLKSM